MQSMTGYGKAEYTSDKLNLVVEIKTVNNRFLDIIPKYPRSFVCFDDLIRKCVASKIARGRVELFVSLTDNREFEKSVNVDMSLAKGYVDVFNQLKNAFPSLASEMSVLSLMKMSDVISQSADTFDGEFYQSILTSTLSLALDNLNQMRFVEGEKLKADLLSRVDFIEKTLSEIEKLAPEIQKNYRIRLEERIKEALDSVKYDEARLLQEVAIFADKSNIDEEITRLKSHIVQFRQIVETENSGRKLDFLVQEFNRESNTICSKSNDVNITKLGLALKCEIEKIREQIQNIE